MDNVGMMLKAFVRRVYQFHMYMIAHAQGKRRGQTKVFPLLLIPLLFLGIVRRFPLESYTDMALLPEYDWVDVRVYSTVREFFASRKINCGAPISAHLSGGTRGCAA